MKFIRYVSCDHVLQEFGSRMLALRLAQNRSRQEVACAAGMSVRGLARFETGAGPLDLMRFVRLCLVLGLRDRVPEWVPECTTHMPRTQRGPLPRRRASKRCEPAPDPLEEPDAYWARVRWIWEP